MSIGHRSIAGRIARSSTVTALAAVFALALVTPALAVAGPTKLSDPGVSPRSATPSDVVSFEVTYRNREGSPPDEVRVVIDGVPYPMTYPAGDEAWKDGVRFRFATTLALGTHTIVFSGTDRERFTDQVDGGTVTVALTPQPASTPTPTAAPAPAATTTPSPGGARVTGGSGTPDEGSDDPGPITTGGTAPLGANVAEPEDDVSPPRPERTAAFRPADPSGPDEAGPSGRDASDGEGTDGPDGLPDGSGAGGGGESADGSGPEGDGSDPLVGGGWGDLARGLQALGVDADRSGLLQVLPTLVSSTGGVALVMAFMFFGKKRRDGEPPAPDEVLHASAARGTELPAAAALVPGTPVDLEASMPRWRRPSLLQARKADPLRDTGPARMSLSFDHGLVGPVDGYERRVIRYRVVRLLDAPDELRSAEVGFLDQGDEVQLLERSGAYWLVLCPDGRRGWLHKMTLGDVVGEQPAPGPLETWGTDSLNAGIDDDVLTAFLAARGRA